MTEAAVKKELQSLAGASSLPPLELTIQLPGEAGVRAGPRPDVLVDVAWKGRARRFVVEVRARSTPKILEEAIRQSKALAQDTGYLPMVVVPYLRRQQLDALADQGVSGIDLCGNGVVVVPGDLLVYRTGNRNRYRESVPTRFAYRGTTSLIPRVFLCRPRFPSVSAVGDEIRRRGGQVALSTVSRALQRMQEDLVIKRDGRSVSLLQADALLDNLATSFVLPTAESKASLKLTVPWRELLQQATADSDAAPVKIAVSGATSAERWAVGGRADAPVVYTDSVSRLVADWLASNAASHDPRFPDVRLYETSDPLPFFDLRPVNGVPWASPVQTFLELSAGDKREKEMAEQVREQILRESRALDGGAAG